MFQTVRQNPKCQDLRPRNGLFAGPSIGQNTGQRWDFG